MFLIPPILRSLPKLREHPEPAKAQIHMFIVNTNANVNFNVMFFCFYQILHAFQKTPAKT